MTPEDVSVVLSLYEAAPLPCGVPEMPDDMDTRDTWTLRYQGWLRCTCYDGSFDSYSVPAMIRLCIWREWVRQWLRERRLFVEECHHGVWIVNTPNYSDRVSHLDGLGLWAKLFDTLDAANLAAMKAVAAQKEEASDA